MIPFDFITEWRARAPWIKDAQVEQDLVISRAMVEIFRREKASHALAFRGGTAIYKLHVTPPPRYSEDIDLVQTDAGPIGKVLDEIRSALDPWLGDPKRALSEGNATLIYRMRSEGQPPLPMRLKIEINSREHFSVLAFEEREFGVRSRWFSGEARIRTYSLDELLGTKLRALYQRKKGRDLFDLWIAGRLKSVDPVRVVECFRRYIAHEGLSVSRAEMEKNFLEKIADPAFAADIEPLVAPGVRWDLPTAAADVRRTFIGRIPGGPWKGARISP